MGLNYAIIEKDKASKLEQEVRSYIEDGWTLQGGISVSLDSVRSPSISGPTSYRNSYCQALTKEDK